MYNLFPRGRVAAMVMILTLALTTSAFAGESGDLDPSFSGDGVASVDFGRKDGASAVFRDARGRIVLAGGSNHVDGKTGFVVALSRLLPDGKLDRSYGDDGRTIVDPSSVNDLFMGAARGPGGKVVILAARGTDYPRDGYTLSRVKPDGRLDRTFGTSGIVKGSWGADQSSWRNDTVVVLPDSRVLVLGQSGDRAVVKRHLANGAIDRSFGVNGRLLIPGAIAYSLVRQGDGRIVVVGMVSDQVMGAWRFSANGDPDRTFGKDGRGTIAGLNGDSVVESAQVAPGGRIYVVGWTFGPTGTTMQGLIAAFTPSGQPARAFSGNGWRRVDLDEVTRFNGLTLTPDGRVLAIGQRVDQFFYHPPVRTRTILVMVRADGSLDPAFGQGGIATLGPGDTAGRGAPGGKDAILQGGLITLAGGAGNDFLAARLHR